MEIHRRRGPDYRRNPADGTLRTKIPGVVFNHTGVFYVFRMNFSWQRGQVMEIFPFPRGTRTI